ncbi:MAG: Asp23/Gls24 family envelope stress response protein [Clostridiales Family XIII bacterium]|jgi:uncharacterized alkaline shock family protein YloU|nr:Asp23/Gls24 family envelope stress response protein [Clostridiales Family XIII bacterium]
MFRALRTEYGLITLDRDVIGHIVRSEVAATDGKVLLSTPKGKLWKQSAIRGDSAGFLECAGDDVTLDIRVFVVIKLGGSINEALEDLISNIYRRIEELLGVKTDSITIAVKGMISKNISKRDFEVKR